MENGREAIKIEEKWEVEVQMEENEELRRESQSIKRDKGQNCQKEYIKRERDVYIVVKDCGF